MIMNLKFIVVFYELNLQVILLHFLSRYATKMCSRTKKPCDHR